LKTRTTGPDTRRAKRRPLVVVVGALVAAVAGVSIVLAFSVFGIGFDTSGGDDPLFDDPMADVQVASATRIDRTVNRKKPVTSTSKNQEPSVLQAFRTAGAGLATVAGRDDLVRQARQAGWTFNTDEPDAEGRMVARRTIANKTARLSAYFSSTEPGVVVLRMIYWE
jgi:hypothetical protein